MISTLKLNNLLFNIIFIVEFFIFMILQYSTIIQIQGAVHGT